MYKSRDYLEANALCPFYKSEYQNSVSCEGIEDGTVASMIKFKNSSDKSKFVNKYCTTKDYTKCSMYKTILGKYKEN